MPRARSADPKRRRCARAQKNEIRRETAFYKWWPGTGNYLPLVVLCGVIPWLLYLGNHSDLVVKAEKKRKSPSAHKDYL